MAQFWRFITNLQNLFWLLKVKYVMYTNICTTYVNCKAKYNVNIRYLLASLRSGSWSLTFKIICGIGMTVARPWVVMEGSPTQVTLRLVRLEGREAVGGQQLSGCTDSQVLSDTPSPLPGCPHGGVGWGDSLQGDKVAHPQGQRRQWGPLSSVKF